MQLQLPEKTQPPGGGCARHHPGRNWLAAVSPRWPHRVHCFTFHPSSRPSAAGVWHNFEPMHGPRAFAGTAFARLTALRCTHKRPPGRQWPEEGLSSAGGPERDCGRARALPRCQCTPS